MATRRQANRRCHRTLTSASDAMKKIGQRSAKPSSRKQRGKAAKHKAPVQRGDETLPAWPSLAQLREHQPGNCLVENDGYHFEQALQ